MSSREARLGTKRAAPQSAAASTNTNNSSRKRLKPSESPKPATSAALEDMIGNPHETQGFLELHEETGDILDAPPNTLIIHACNCQGHWGAGIAKAFKDRYPAAHEYHKEYCEEHHHTLLDSAQLIPPVDAGVESDVENGEVRGGKSDDKNAIAGSSRVPKHFVGCLFTSRRYGREKDTPKRILAATKPAMEDLLEQVKAWNGKAKTEEDRVQEVRMCKINSGLFAVPWERSKRMLESINVSESDVKVIKVVSRQE